MRLIVDGNSYLNAALLRDVDHENGRKVTDDDGKPVQVNSAQHGIDGFFDKLLAALKKFNLAPRSVVVAWDGQNAKLRRRAYLPGYKAGRDKHPAVSEQLNIARQSCTSMLMDLGATVVEQSGMEADDVIGYLCATARDQVNVVCTDDGDLNVLVDDNTHVWRLGELDKNPYGPFPHKYIRLYKTLVGDSGDKIPGAYKFGDTAWLDLVRIFGLDGLEEMERMIVHGQLHELKESVADLKSLARILEDVAGVNNSYNCARLHIEDVNRPSKPLSVKAGMVKQFAQVQDNFPPGFEDFYGSKTLVTAKNFIKAKAQFATAVQASPFVALDLESSTGEESDDWLAQVSAALEKAEDKVGIDVLGQELAGMSLTFGTNCQHTVYISVNHRDTDNFTTDQWREFVEQIPKGMEIVIQNRNFEFSVLYRLWGEAWKDNGWAGLLPNAVDTKIGASYVDENLPKGLKQRSKAHLGYEQTSYEATTTKSGPLRVLDAGGNEVTYTRELGKLIGSELTYVSNLPSGGKRRKLYEKVISEAIYEEVYALLPDPETGEPKHQTVQGDLLHPEVVEVWEDRQYKMHELTAREVFDYGCDDTICTASLHTYYLLVMAIEGTLQAYYAVELYPEYLTSLAYVQGIPIDLAKVLDMERRDDAAYDEAWKVLRTYLLSKGWEGTVCPEFEGDIEPSDVKLAAEVILDGEFSTRKRKLNAIAADLREQYPDNATAEVLAMAVESNNVAGLNDLVARHFTGEPKINFGSPKQMQNLFYRVMKLTPRIFNSLTDKQRQDKVMASAFRKQRQREAGGTVGLSEAELDALISKASTDDTAVDWALHADNLAEAEVKVLHAYQTIKTVQTRRNLFYRTYKALPHWRDGRVHPSLNQCEAVTRRYSSSGPNVQQLPKKDEGLEFREVIRAHHKDAVVVSMDFSGQELRLGAELSGDEAMTSCFVGEHLRDMHSLTAVKAAPFLWGEEIEYEVFIAMLDAIDKEVKARAKSLRGSAKTVNFASQYGAMAKKIAQTLLTDVATAQAFLDARAAAFPSLITWSERVQAEAKEMGYALTMLGARRHLNSAINAGGYEAMKAERQAGNFWIQGSAAEMTKLAMSRMWKSGVFWDGRFDAVFYAPVHDEVVFSVHRRQAIELIKLVHPMMVQNYADMRIPIVSSISLGRNFGKQIECGDRVDEKTLQDALDSAFSA